MAKASQQSNLVKRVGAPTGITVAQPDFLKNEKVVGVDRLAQFVTPPYMKIVQKQSNDELLEAFGKGHVLLMPNQAVICEPGGSFCFVPLFFYTEYISWAPIEVKGMYPAILDRSTDANSTLAIKATNNKTWSEQLRDASGNPVIKDGKPMMVRHVEHLNFVAVLYNHPLGTDPFVMGFARGEHKTGRALCNIIKMRKASPFSCVFEAKMGEPRGNEKGSWHGLDIDNPSGDQAPWVNEAEYNALKVKYEEVLDFFRKGRLRAQYDEAEAQVAGTATVEDRNDI